MTYMPIPEDRKRTLATKGNQENQEVVFYTYIYNCTYLNRILCNFEIQTRHIMFFIIIIDKSNIDDWLGEQKVASYL